MATATPTTGRVQQTSRESLVRSCAASQVPGGNKQAASVRRAIPLHVTMLHRVLSDNACPSPAKINRQPGRLEIAVSSTKQKPAAQFNRQQIGTSRSRTSWPFREKRARHDAPVVSISRRRTLATSHLSLATAFFTTRRISNRHTPRLESAISRRKQTLHALSNRHFLQVSECHQRRIASASRPPQVASNNVSNRQWQILENTVNLSKQTIAPRSNRHKNALFAFRVGSRNTGHGSRITVSRVTNHYSPITNHASPGPMIYSTQAQTPWSSKP